MKKIAALTVIALALILSGQVMAQPAGGPGTGPGMGRGMGPGGGMGPMMYNPQSVTTIKGTVEGPGPQMGRRMQHESWTVKTDKGTVTVHLGPKWYLAQQQAVINPGDAIEATGSQMEMGGGTMMVAKSVTVKGKTYQLRNDQGLPLWRGQGPMMPPR